MRESGGVNCWAGCACGCCKWRGSAGEERKKGGKTIFYVLGGTNLVDRNSVLFAHFIELIDTHNPSIGQHHSLHKKTCDARFTMMLTVSPPYGTQIKTMTTNKSELLLVTPASSLLSPESRSVVTAAVKPTPEEPRPVVLIAG